MKRVAVLAGSVLVFAGAWLLLSPLRVSDTAGHTRRCGPSLLRVITSGTHDGLCDTATGFVIFGALTAAAGVAVILLTLFAARPLANAWVKAVDQARASRE